MTNNTMKIENPKEYINFYKDSVPQITEGMSINDLVDYLGNKDTSNEAGLLAMFIDESLKNIITIYKDKSVFIWSPAFRESWEITPKTVSVLDPDKGNWEYGTSKIEFLCSEELKYPGRFKRIF